MKVCEILAVHHVLYNFKLQMENRVVIRQQLVIDKLRSNGVFGYIKCSARKWNEVNILEKNKKIFRDKDGWNTN